MSEINISVIKPYEKHAQGNPVVQLQTSPQCVIKHPSQQATRSGLFKRFSETQNMTIVKIINKF